MKIFVFFGPAGSGKGTQAQYLKSDHGFHHLSTGDMLRSEVNSNSDLGNKVKSVIDSGNLVTDEIILDIIAKNISTLTSGNDHAGIVFDGFPRTIAQANGFDAILSSMNLSVDQAFLFDLSLEASLDRIAGRRIDSRNNDVYHINSNPAPESVVPFLIHRDDDQPEKVTHRYELYKQQTQPLVEFYSDRLITVDCELTISQIHAQFDQQIRSFEHKF